ncbi:MAG TPA: response regulator, partial [Rhodospirillaceae bacterium]|nr:response regulator [Rhodospirillaceae bacterium]
VQYRGKLMPLVTIDGSTETRTEGQQPVLVFADGDRNMGLVVDEIVDIVEEQLKVELAVDAPGLIGTAVVSGKATDIIDAGYYLTQAWGDWFGSPDKEFQGVNEPRRILLVDDSPFFRNLLTPLLSVAGYDVVSVDSADKALSLREAGDVFDVIISDIEMPGMNGFEFAMAVRAEGRWAELPMVALSSHATEKDFERGREVGFTDYVAKFDRDALLQTLSQTFSAKGDA